jgi:hypothetical protein
MNAKIAGKNFREEKDQIISSKVIGKKYKSLRNVLYNYLFG